MHTAFFFVRILVCGDFDRVFIPHVLTYFGFGGHNSYSYTVLFTRAQHENNTKSRLPTLEDEKLRIFRVFQTIYVSLYTSKVTFPCIQRKSMCFSRNVSLPRLRPTYFRSVPSLSAQKKNRIGQARIRSHAQITKNNKKWSTADSIPCTGSSGSCRALSIFVMRLFKSLS